MHFKATLEDDLGEFFAEVEYLSSIPFISTNSARLFVNQRAILGLGLTANLRELPYLRGVEWLKKWTLGLEVKNVNDATVYDAHNYPLPGRMFFATLRAVI